MLYARRFCLVFLYMYVYCAVGIERQLQKLFSDRYLVSLSG